ncbi:MAG: aminotransferase class III-fold pyridoxal phosphate-dependent enzyme [Rhodothermales bacterium]|nr:aminotransferase class III-fold pyridoxal phosphate-dependent enzyme [Rhodothermales bacterium]
MHDLVAERPRLSAAEAERLTAAQYGIAGTAAPLPSDRDQNFRVETPEGAAYVLKIAHAGEDPALLEAQHAVLGRLAAASIAVPRVHPSVRGDTLLALDGAEGRRHLVRLLSYLPGVPMATATPHTPVLLHSLGGTLGRVAAALDGFDHPGAHRHHVWDVQHAPETIRTYLAAIPSPARRALVARLLDRFGDAAARGGTLRKSVIHGDANDYNVLVDPAPGADRAVVGLIDFGDLVYSWTVADLAIACAYAMLGKADPVGAAGHVAAGFHAAFTLTEPEIEALFPLSVLRLCVSVCMAAHQQQQEPENEYLTISERPAWALLDRLDRLPPALARYRLRHACGLPPCPSSEPVTRWIQEHAATFAPVVHPDPRTAPVVVFDFSVGSTEWEPDALTEPMLAADAITGRLRAAGAALGVGRYDEARLVYTAPQFQTGPAPSSANRTIHLGLDLFQEAGAPVSAPLAGTVHSAADNAHPLDYGPTVILRHEPEDGPTFFTLYGHLSRASLRGLRAGQRVESGEQIGTLGTPDENGGWAPHLHVQILCDLLGMEGDFPGVAPPGERAVWRSLCPDPNLLVGIPEAAFPAPAMEKATIQALRARHVGPSLSLSYRDPLHIVRGRGAYLYDPEGRAFLDGVNNVAHVGHGHPRVVAAAQRQMAVLNTNTRYLHAHLARYAERLAALLPDPLSVCFFVNSGSEANDLALRLAFAHTGRRDVVVLDGGYHGNLSSLVAVSPYKFDGAGGGGRPPHTHVAPLPDPYRGPHRGTDAGARYAAGVAEAVARCEAQGGVAAFLAEPILGCGGQVEPPPGFLVEAFRHVRAAGGVCIADEVQIGFGRLGTHFWGFETQAAVPDVVTMGKPIGNGHPLGAVVTTPAIAASFANGMEYFNTFGGNPVSCAVGLAVLDVIEGESLQAHALRVGTRLKARLEDLATRHPVVGDVRGRGLFLGVELVRSRETLAPAPGAAAYVANRMREEGILLSTDGPLHNVLKIKPPLCFSEADADRLAGTLDRVLAEDAVRAATR